MKPFDYEKATEEHKKMADELLKKNKAFKMCQVCGAPQPVLRKQCVCGAKMKVPYFLNYIMPLVVAIPILLFIYSLFAPLNENQIESTSKELVTEILNDQLDIKSDCESVDILQKLNDKEYIALAELDDGNNLEIRIKVEGKMVEVMLNNLPNIYPK